MNYKLDEGFLDIVDKTKRLFSNFVEKIKENSIYLRCTKDELEGLIIEFKKFMQKNNFKEIKHELDELFSFVHDSDVVKIFKPVKLGKDFELLIKFN